MSNELSKLAWKAQRPGGEAALRALQAALKREYGPELSGAIAKAKRRERKTGREQTVTFAPTMERAYHKYANKPETIAWYRKQLWPFSVSARPDQSRATAPVVWSTGHHYDVHDWARRKRQRWAGGAERRAARAMHDPSPRIRPTNVRRDPADALHVGRRYYIAWEIPYGDREKGEGNYTVIEQRAGDGRWELRSRGKSIYLFDREIKEVVPLRSTKAKRDPRARRAPLKRRTARPAKRKRIRG